MGNYDEIINTITFKDLALYDDKALMYIYAVKKATPEERASIFRALGSYKNKAGKVVKGSIAYANSSHEGIPVFIEPIYPIKSGESSLLWIDTNGEFVSEKPFEIDANGRVKLIEEQKQI